MSSLRSSRPEVFCKRGILRNFTEKHLCQSFFFNKVAGLRPTTTLYKKETLVQLLSIEFCEISKNTFFQRTPLLVLLLGVLGKFAKCTGKPLPESLF